MRDDGPDDYDRLAECFANIGLDLGQARHAARVGLRWDNDVIRHHALLHCRKVHASHRYSVNYQELHPKQQNAINREVAAILNTFAGRMTDLHFIYLPSDERDQLQPERVAVPRIGGVQ